MSARLIALYLPQYYPIPENNRWWCEGFTEWTNVAKARPLFRGHYQPHLPANLGFYDLRVPETRLAQASLAAKYGIEAFCYWHYWFGNGSRILQRPFDEVLKSGEPNFPFCLGWANETWTGTWHGSSNRVLIEQKYPGWDDHKKHFDFFLQAFSDPRYVCVDGKPILFIYRPAQIPQCHKVMDLWRELAEKNHFPGLHLVAQAPTIEWNPYKNGFDAMTISLMPTWELHTFTQKIRNRIERNAFLKSMITRVTEKPLNVYPYREAIKYFIMQNIEWEYYPMVIPNWDNTPRTGRYGLVYTGSTPELFKMHLRDALSVVSKLDENRRILFIKSWNEWAEGNHLEPDQQFGLRYLEVINEVLTPLKTNLNKLNESKMKTSNNPVHYNQTKKCI